MEMESGGCKPASFPRMSTVDGEHKPAESLPALSLADLSRNASAISTDSSDSSPSVPFLAPRPRPNRPFSAPRSLSPHSSSPWAQHIPTYLSAELSGDNRCAPDAQALAQARARSKSRGRPSMTTTDDFKFGATLGEGSYSTVRFAVSLATRTSNSHPLSTNRSKGQHTSLPVSRMPSRSSRNPISHAITKCTPPLQSVMPSLL
jgi:hypothetical protein